ncbi:MAG: hypothetical protein ABIP30_15000, partial [Ferruginibacter sp.]
SARPQIKSLVNTTASQLKGHTISLDSLRAAIKNKPQSVKLNDYDIDALTMIVLMKVNNDAENDLRDQMSNMKKINDQKKAQRDAINKRKAQQDSIKNKMAAEYRAGQKAGKVSSTVSFNDYLKQREVKMIPTSDSQDAVSDMSAQMQMSLQLAMDRKSKMNEMISNLMKSFSDTQNAIISNLK